MRASVMLHLPALGLTKQIEKVFRALQKINLAVRGLYGEGSRALGRLLPDLQPGDARQERGGDPERDPRGDPADHQVRTAGPLDADARDPAEHPGPGRPRLGTLQSATMMTSEETMELLSTVRLGIHLRLIDDLSPVTVNELFIHTQPAHLQKLIGEPLDGEERNAARARYLRTRLPRRGRSDRHDSEGSDERLAACFACFTSSSLPRSLSPGPSHCCRRSRPNRPKRVLGDSFSVFVFGKGVHVAAFAFLTILGGTALLLRAQLGLGPPRTRRPRRTDRDSAAVRWSHTADRGCRARRDRGCVSAPWSSSVGGGSPVP